MSRKRIARPTLFLTLLTEMHRWAEKEAAEYEKGFGTIPARVRAGIFLMLYREESCTKVHRLNDDSNTAEVRQLIYDACPCGFHTPGNETKVGPGYYNGVY